MNTLDTIATYNRDRWNAIVTAGSQYTRPFLHLTSQSAQAWLNENETLAKAGLTDLKGKDVLCLAGGGGQQTAVFALAGATVTILDLSDNQLAGDKKAAEHHNYAIRIEQGDMRDLSRFENDSFDLVYQPFSINFVPDAGQVIKEVGRILKPNGVYNLDFANPFWTMEESDWTPKGYPVRQPYINGSKHLYVETAWDVEDANGNWTKVEGPHEYLHTLSAIINSLVNAGFHIFHFAESPEGDNSAEPGSWEHLCSIIPPFLTVGARLLP